MKNILKIIITILVLITATVYIIAYKRDHPNVLFPNTVTTQGKNNSVTPITITTEIINEENFTGTRSIIAGSGVLVDVARAYIYQTVTEFKQMADEEVPDMRIKFGADAPPANYTIDVKAVYLKAPKTESIIIDRYAYTGGANGNSSYKVFTASSTGGKILSLGDVIAPDKQSALTSFVKSQLLSWRPEDISEQVVFPDEVSKLTFESFSNWSFDDGNLIIYFDKYAIGPGALGAVAYPLKLTRIQSYLRAGY